MVDIQHSNTPLSFQVNPDLENTSHVVLIPPHTLSTVTPGKEDQSVSGAEIKRLLNGTFEGEEHNRIRQPKGALITAEDWKIGPPGSARCKLDADNEEAASRGSFSLMGARIRGDSIPRYVPPTDNARCVCSFKEPLGPISMITLYNINYPWVNPILSYIYLANSDSIFDILYLMPSLQTYCPKLCFVK